MQGKKRLIVLVSIIVVVILIGLGFYLYKTNISNNKKFTISLALIQENSNEIANAKIMGDSIIAKKNIPGSSMVRVKSTAELVSNRLEFMSVPKELLDYKQSIIDWSQLITKAVDDTKTWSSVSNQPRDFQLKLSQKQSEKLFQDSVNKITELKEFGDNAIKRKDRITMLYIAAKLSVQEHWLNGILHSQNAGLLSFNNLVSPALALGYGDIVPRKICIGTGGLSVGDHTTNVFCVEDAIQSTNEIKSSTIGFAEGKKGAEDDWDNNWHKEGGLGVISQGETTNTSGKSPALQAFYNTCQNNGGIVGGAGTVKTGLPTTESGYTCEYKIKDKDGASIPCWDFMTYSGGRYMGGNNGCQEKNLLPKIDDQTIKDKTAGLGGKWDGNYALSGTTIKCAGDFAYSIPIPAVVAGVRDNIMSTTQGPMPINGSSVVWTMSTSTQQENATVNISEIDTFGFYQSGNTTGVSGTYSANIIVSNEDQIKVSSCYGSIGGARQ